MLNVLFIVEDGAGSTEGASINRKIWKISVEIYFFYTVCKLHITSFEHLALSIISFCVERPY
jgi:hypothetical protein